MELSYKSFSSSMPYTYEIGFLDKPVPALQIRLRKEWLATLNRAELREVANRLDPGHVFAFCSLSFDHDFGFEDAWKFMGAREEVVEYHAVLPMNAQDAQDQVIAQRKREALGKTFALFSQAWDNHPTDNSPAFMSWCSGLPAEVIVHIRQIVVLCDQVRVTAGLSV